MPAPVVLFAYKRPDSLRQTLLSLRLNELAAETDLHVFSDGAGTPADQKKVQEVRDQLKQINGFATVQVWERQENLGLARSVIQGVSSLIQEYGRVIVVEDDLQLSSNFLLFMNQALNHYAGYQKVFSVSGYTPRLPRIQELESDVYFGWRASSWGWATWADRWLDVPWQIEEEASFQAQARKWLRLYRVGSDLPGMLRNQKKGKVDSWAVRWCAHQIENRYLTVFPKVSKVQNRGFADGATHTKTGGNKFRTLLDAGQQQVFEFPDHPQVIRHLSRSYSRLYSPYRRLLDKLERYG